MSNTELSLPSGVESQLHVGNEHVNNEFIIQAGRVLVQHQHKTGHLSVLLRGKAEVMVGDVKSTYTGPCAIYIDAGKHHGVKAITDIVWLCIHDMRDLDMESAGKVQIVDGNKEEADRLIRALL